MFKKPFRKRGINQTSSFRPFLSWKVISSKYFVYKRKYNCEILTIMFWFFAMMPVMIQATVLIAVKIIIVTTLMNLLKNKPIKTITKMPTVLVVSPTVAMPIKNRVTVIRVAGIRITATLIAQTVITTKQKKPSCIKRPVNIKSAGHLETLYLCPSDKR